MANLPPNITETAQDPDALATQLPLVVNPPAFTQLTEIRNALQQLQQDYQQFFQHLRQQHRQLQQDHYQLQHLVRGIETALTESCVFLILDSYGI